MERYSFLREALEEYEDAVSYYERARSGLGHRFADEVDRVIALTLEFPEMGARHEARISAPSRRAAGRRARPRVQRVRDLEVVPVLRVGRRGGGDGDAHFSTYRYGPK